MLRMNEEFRIFIITILKILNGRMDGWIPRKYISVLVHCLGGSLNLDVNKILKNELILYKNIFKIHH